MPGAPDTERKGKELYYNKAGVLEVDGSLIPKANTTPGF